ncbi:TlpA family protein disulfide reductase [Peptostreptococcus sp. D1]|uniref:TlpA family protein disulfide reductase n=1 Tax=Peptostreptococcus sp. D1 TaxID=72304 RepID=UPI0008EFB637|nr:TlpA disulfide reductase family protein [Peptostreptococcus sp. D1]SFE14155.1 Thiol-disulfide isomerase or thioredoxin [Peptostreptococcus sp. D1]
MFDGDYCIWAGCLWKKNDKKVSTDKSPVSSEAQKKSSGENIGKFEATDLENNKVTQDIFKENDLTLVNLLSSTCNPCMEELPHLAELSNEYKDKKVGVLGVNIDMDSKGNPDEDSKKALLKILSKKKNNMKVIFMEQNLMNKLMKKTEAIPYTFFVDKNGNIVGEEYLGDRSKEDWAKIIDKELKNVSKK